MDESCSQIIILAVVQGLAELLPVSSSAHVIVAEKLLGMPPLQAGDDVAAGDAPYRNDVCGNPLFLAGLEKKLFASRAVFKQQAVRLLLATMLTAAVGVPLLGIEKGVEKSGLPGQRCQRASAKAEIESLFGNLGLIAGALSAAGVLILIAGLAERATARNRDGWDSRGRMDRRRPRAVSAVPRVLAFRGNDFHRLAAGRSQGAGGGIQLRSGSNHYSGGDRARGVAVHQSPSRSLEFRT